MNSNGSVTGNSESKRRRNKFVAIPDVGKKQNLFTSKSSKIMEDKITEKVYCYDHPSAYNNHDAMAIAAMCNNRRDNDPMTMAAMMGGGFGANQWMNNPFAYMMMMAWMRMFGDNGWNGNGNGAQNIEMQNQLQAIRTQLQDNQNASLLRDAIGDGFNRNDFALSQLAQNLNVDFNTLQKCCCEVQSAIQQVGGQVGFSAERVINAVNMGDCRVIEALKDCCCQTNQNLLRFQGDIQLQMCKQTNTLQNGQEFINRSIERGFAASSYETQKQTCDIITAGNANTQRIIDTLNNHWNDENNRKIQDLKFELSQERQNNFIASKIASMGGCGCGNNGCGCGCGCGCGQ